MVETYDLFTVILSTIFGFGLMFFLGLCWWNIFKKAGYGRGVGLFMLVPFVSFFAFLVLAFSKWPILKEKDKG